MTLQIEESIEHPQHCPFCNGTGIAECVDFAELLDIPNGSYAFDELSKRVPCPDCVKDN